MARVGVGADNGIGCVGRMEPVAITEATDPRVADYIGLRDPHHRQQLEGDEFFIAEGINVIERLIASRYALRSVLISPRRYDRMEPMLRDVACPVYIADREVMTQVAGFDLHRGAVASADRGRPMELIDLLTTSRTIAVLEGLNDPENLGAIARSARALGIDGLVLDPTCADPFYRRTVRVSMGEVLFLPIVRSSDWVTDLDAIATHGFRLLGLTPAQTATSIGDVSRVEGDRLALLLGAEGPGLSSHTLARVEPIRIPLRGDVDSLNVGHAAAIAFALLAVDLPD
ncbi:MAG: rRNA methyltransferase [Ilumatobacteraceae bacterium]|nr:rRNA methyltransferase [Ilumatobacteraceae bacterium]